MKNAYEVRGDVTAIFLDSKKYGKFETIISTSKLEKVKSLSITWGVEWNPYTKSFYVKGNIPLSNGRTTTIKLHRWIMDAPKNKVVDHFDHDTLNNIDSNLRIATKSQNAQNIKGAHTDSKSGVLGVCWNKRKKKWYARVTINGKGKHLGYFRDLKDAEQTVFEARMHHMPYSQEASF